MASTEVLKASKVSDNIQGLSDDLSDSSSEGIKMEADIESDADLENTTNDTDSNDTRTSHGWADAMAKILQKQSKDTKHTILTKAKKQTDSSKQEKEKIHDVEVVDNEGKIKKTKTGEKTEQEHEEEWDYKTEKERRFKKRLWEDMCKVKPDIVADKEKERNLQRIATKGVVQLFNAVRKQQNTVEEKMKEVGSSEVKRSKVMNSLNKGTFLDMLKGTTANVTLDTRKDTSKSIALTSEDSEKPNWSVLRDDFMMGAKMKDWDKQSVSENESEQDSASDSDG